MRTRMEWLSAGLGIFFAVFLLLAAYHQGARVKHQKQPVGAGMVEVPRSSIENPSGTGVRTHSNVEIFVPNGASPQPPAKEFYSKEAAPAPSQSDKPRDGSE